MRQNLHQTEALKRRGVEIQNQNVKRSKQRDSTSSQLFQRRVPYKLAIDFQRISELLEEAKEIQDQSTEIEKEGKLYEQVGYSFDNLQLQITQIPFYDALFELQEKALENSKDLNAATQALDFIHAIFKQNTSDDQVMLCILERVYKLIQTHDSYIMQIKILKILEEVIKVGKFQDKIQSI